MIRIFLVMAFAGLCILLTTRRSGAPRFRPIKTS